MVKFSHELDSEYRKVADHISQMIRKSLDLEQGNTVAQTSQQLSKPLGMQLAVQVPQQQLRTVREVCQPGVIQTSWEDIIRSILSQNYLDQLKEVRVPLEGTCEWIRQKIEYSNWESDANSSILFVLGQIGCGKSVIARSIIESIRDSPSSYIILTYFFCKSQNRRNTARAILEAVLVQIDEAEKGILSQAMKGKYIPPEKPRIEVLYELFKATRFLIQKPICL